VTASEVAQWVIGGGILTNVSVARDGSIVGWRCNERTLLQACTGRRAEAIGAAEIAKASIVAIARPRDAGQVGGALIRTDATCAGKFT
jgi:hypothetical protein